MTYTFDWTGICTRLLRIKSQFSQIFFGIFGSYYDYYYYDHYYYYIITFIIMSLPSFSVSEPIGYGGEKYHTGLWEVAATYLYD